MSSDVIIIDRLLARTVIGLNEWERRVRQDVLISARLWLDLRKAGFSDSVHDTLNYGTLIRQILAHVETSERHTVEALAGDVAGICLAWPQAARARVRVTKPAADRFARSVGVAIERTRDQLLQDAYVAIGSNVEPEKHLRAAAAALAALGEFVGVSPVYQTAAVGGQAPDFLNVVVGFRTCLPAAEVRRRLKAIEKKLGREPGERIAVDLDLCLLGDQVIDAAEVRLPHPEILERRYLALSLAEMSPPRDLRHPVTHEPIREIAKRLSNQPEPKRRQDVSVIENAGGAGGEGGGGAWT